MNIKNFSHQMSGLWISQSTNYSLLQNQDKISNTHTNKIKWTDVSNNLESFKWMQNNLKEKYHKNVISLCQVDFSNSQLNHQRYYVLLCQDKFSQIFLVKFNQNLLLINKFKIQVLASNYICLTSKTNTATVIEKIYFLNDKVKLIKSVVKKHNKYVATYFSSEIKIS